MSPEQGMGKPVTGAADQYSVAVMTYRLLSGQVPFEGDSAIDILHKHCTILPPPLDQLCPGLPDYVYKAVEKGLSKKPAQRFSTVKAFVKGLKEKSPEITLSDAETIAADSDPSILGDLPTEVMDAADTPQPDVTTTAAPTPGPPPWHADKKKGGLWKVLVPLIVILAVGGGGGTWWWLRQRAGSGPTGGQTQAEQTDPSAAEPGDVSQVGEAAAAAVAESTAAEAAPPEPTAVSVSGMMPSGLVIVDGVAQSSLEFELTPGEPHVIEMRQAGYETVVDTVTFEAGQSVRYPYVGRSTARPTQTQTQRPTPRRPAAPRTGILRISVNVVADVSIGSQTHSSVRRIIDTLTASQPHTIRFRRDGYVPKDTIVTIPAGETVTIRITLQEGTE
jgi:hypothetical protein